jgi:hypothetical protein
VYTPRGFLRELYVLLLQHGASRRPIGYDLPLVYRCETSGTSQIFPVNHLTACCDMLQLHGYDPLSAHRRPVADAILGLVNRHRIGLRYGRTRRCSTMPGADRARGRAGQMPNDNPVQLSDEQFHHVKTTIRRRA